MYVKSIVFKIDTEYIKERAGLAVDGKQSVG